MRWYLTMVNFDEIKIVLWDVDGTVLNFTESQKNAIRACFAKFELGECTDEMLADYDGINHKYWKALERGEITKPEVLTGRFREFFSKYGIKNADFSSDELIDAFNDEYQIRLGDTICFTDGVREVIEEFKQRGVVQFAVTNGTKRAQQRKLALSGLDQIFDAIFISEDIGSEKPNPLFFEPVLAKAKELIPDVRLQDMVIIGDSLTSDMRLGNNVGIRTCWYDEKASGRSAEEVSREENVRIDMVIDGFVQASK